MTSRLPDIINKPKGPAVVSHRGKGLVEKQARKLFPAGSRFILSATSSTLGLTPEFTVLRPGWKRHTLVTP